MPQFHETRYGQDWFFRMAASHEKMAKAVDRLAEADRRSHQLLPPGRQSTLQTRNDGLETEMDQKSKIPNPKFRPKGENTMLQPSEMSVRGAVELAGAACGLLVLGFCFLVLAFCV